MSKKPTREEIAKMSLTDYNLYASAYCYPCASCGQIGERVAESIEGKGYHYCEDTAACRTRKS